MHVSRPFRRAHAHHRALGFRVVASGALADERAADLVPDFLALEDHPVEVEDDGIDHNER